MMLLSLKARSSARLSPIWAKFQTKKTVSGEQGTE